VKILIVSAYFPPQNSIASLRPYSWAKWWSKAGHEVTVITTVKIKRENDLILGCSGFDVVSLPIPFFLNASSAYHSTVIKSEQKNGKLLLSFIKKSYSSFLKNTGCFNTCRFHDFHDLWAKKTIKKISHINFDLIISTGGPYSVHRVGLAMKKKYPETKWIVDWRDLWTQNHLFKGLRIFWFYERYLERKFHNCADLITTVSEPLADTLRKITKTRIEVIYNGYDPDDYIKIKQRVRKKNDAFTIAYIGTIYRGYQDPSPLFEALSDIKKNNLIEKNVLQIIFAGTNADISDIAERYNVSEFYSYLGFLPREQALQLQYDADAVLFLEYNNPSVPGILTGKLFEYIYIGREIIAIGVDEPTVAGKLITDTKTGSCFGTDVKKIEEYLITRINIKQEHNLKRDENLLQEFERKNQAVKLLNIVNGMK
jgi:glycosyltransferase involved in cell wall biosynthesis